jgi:signal transduction histidine kinase
MSETGGDLAVRVSIDAAGWQFTVSDQGTGIPAGFEEKIFEVGFTTRTGPIHMGMGLPVARHLAEQEGGTLQLANGAGGGCEATIRLPMKPRG